MTETNKSLGISRRWIIGSVILVFIFKLVFSYLFFQLQVTQKPDRRIGSLSFASGDYTSYLGAMENYVSRGTYYFINQSGDTVRTGRPPHYAFPYWLGRQFSKQETAADLLTISTILIDSFAILCLALMAAGISTDPKRAYLITLIAGIISCYVSNWSILTLPDAPGAALFLIGFYFYWKAFTRHEGRPINILLASLFLSWSVVLRPFIIVVAVIMTLIFLLKVRMKALEYFKLAFLASLPLLLFIAPWLARNYEVTGKVVPFQQDIYAGYGYKPTELASRRLMTAIGEDGGTFWDPTAMASYFSPGHYKTSTFQYGKLLRNDSMYIKELEVLRSQYINTFYVRSDADERQMVQEMRKLRLEYMSHHKVQFYFLNPIKRTLKFWGHSGSYYISTEKASIPFLVKIVKYIQSVLYYLVLILGTIGIFKMARKNAFGWALLSPLIILTIFFPMLNGFMEPRYALAFYYPGLLGLIYLLDSYWKKWRLHEVPIRNPLNTSL